MLQLIFFIYFIKNKIKINYCYVIIECINYTCMNINMKHNELELDKLTITSYLYCFLRMFVTLNQMHNYTYRFDDINHIIYWKLRLLKNK